VVSDERVPTRLLEAVTESTESETTLVTRRVPLVTTDL
jgi:hypothetical protein